MEIVNLSNLPGCDWKIIAKLICIVWLTICAIPKRYSSKSLDARKEIVLHKTAENVY